MLVSIAVGEANYFKYKDPEQPLNVRINDLMNRMTLAEKIGQMSQIERVNATSDVMKNYFIGANYLPESFTLSKINRKYIVFL